MARLHVLVILVSPVASYTIVQIMVVFVRIRHQHALVLLLIVLRTDDVGDFLEDQFVKTDISHTIDNNIIRFVHIEPFTTEYHSILDEITAVRAVDITLSINNSDVLLTQRTQVFSQRFSQCFLTLQRLQLILNGFREQVACGFENILVCE